MVQSPGTKARPGGPFSRTTFGQDEVAVMHATVSPSDRLLTGERRRHMRLAVKERIIYARRPAGHANDWNLAWLFDVCPCGIGLLTTRAPETGEVIDLELHDVDRHRLVVCRVAVRHVTRRPDGRWLVGGFSLNHELPTMISDCLLSADA